MGVKIVDKIDKDYKIMSIGNDCFSIIKIKSNFIKKDGELNIYYVKNKLWVFINNLIKNKYNDYFKDTFFITYTSKFKNINKNKNLIVFEINIFPKKNENFDEKIREFIDDIDLNEIIKLI
jgi:hypothetical protein